MDRNLYLLNADEIRLIQDINTIGEDGSYRLLGDQFTFKDVKDSSTSLPVDLVILDQQHTGYDVLSDALEEEIQAIRGIIDEERRRRRGEGQFNNDDGEWRGEWPEEWPHLPNYDHPDSIEPSIADWDDDEPIPFTGLSEGDTFGTFVTPEGVRRHHGIIEINPQGYPTSFSSWLNQQEVEDEDQIPFSSTAFTNSQLKQLDMRIGRLKWDLLRIRNSSLLGRYVERISPTGRVLDRTIYLLIDNIYALADGDSLPHASALAEVYVHEMFHAYFANLKRPDIINAYLQGISQIEEPLTEFAMLNFINDNYPAYFNDAYTHVVGKADSGDPNLQIYGLGACLFYVLRNFSPSPRWSVLKVYQTIQPVPRLSMKLVRLYIKKSKESILDPMMCTEMLVNILTWMNTIMQNPSQHYKFSDHTLGSANHIVWHVVNHYAQNYKPSFPSAVYLFRNSYPGFGRYGVFADRTTITHTMAKNYMMDIPIILGDGTEIVVAKQWAVPEFNNFLIHVMNMKLRGRIDARVQLLG